MNTHKLSFFFLALFLFCYLLIGLDFSLGLNLGLNRQDEGFTVYGAARVMKGDIPYKDFWTTYMPAHFHFLAIIFKLFGISLWVERVWSIVGQFFMSVMVYLIGKKLYGEKFAVLTWIFIVIWIGGIEVFGYPVPWAVFFSLSSILLFLKFLAKRSMPSLYFSGIFTGTTILYRQDVGFYNFTSEILILIPFLFIFLTDKRQRIFERCKTLTKITLRYYVLGVMTVGLPVLLYFVNVVPIRDLISDLIIYPFAIYLKLYFLSYPNLFADFSYMVNGTAPLTISLLIFSNNFSFYFPLIIYGSIIIIYALKIHKKELNWEHVEIWSIILITLLGILSFNAAKNRADLPHLIATMPLASILFFLIMHNISQWLNGFKTFRYFSFIVCSIIFVIVIWSPLRIKIFNITNRNELKKQSFSLELARGEGIRVSHALSNYQSAIQYIQNKVPAGERIFVGKRRHDKITLNDIMFYFLADRDSATKYHDLARGVATTRGVQEDIIKDIKKHNVIYIVLWDLLTEEPNESNKSSGVTMLDDFIHSNYSLEKQFGDYLILRKKFVDKEESSFTAF